MNEELTKPGKDLHDVDRDVNLVIDLGDDIEDIEQIRADLLEAPGPGPSPFSQCVTWGLCPLLPCTYLCSLFAVNPQEQVVILSCGHYADTIKDPGVHCFTCWGRTTMTLDSKLTAMELAKTTVLDVHGNPLLVSAVVTYEVVNARRALLDVNNVHQYIQAHAEAALKAGLAKFPYESLEGEPCLKTEATQIGKQLCHVLQNKSKVAGVLIHSFQLKEISYAPEIAGVMLRRQQAQALIDARNKIVEGAVEICVNAIDRLRTKGIDLSDGLEGQIVKNLLTVSCSDGPVSPTLPL